MKKILNTLFFMLALTVILGTGSVRAEAATADSKAGIVATKQTNLNLRSSASTSGTIVKSVSKGSYLTLLEKKGSWWKVEYAKGKTAYGHGDFISSLSDSKAMQVATASTSLNVRSSGSANAKIKDKLEKNTIVVRLSDSGAWSKILYHGNKTGYVSSSYLSSAASSSGKYTKVSLAVPSFKQNDERWAKVKIGTQGDTLASSGCTTTALAMTESFHQKKTVTPKDMTKKLSYSSSGLLYWPNDYATEIITSSNYLSRVYSLLKAGKPVVLGMKKSNGTQHWVVVTGHTKSATSLSASNFTINDPGSNTRTVLSDFVKAYPNAYKIAYKK